MGFDRLHWYLRGKDELRKFMKERRSLVCVKTWFLSSVALFCFLALNFSNLTQEEHGWAFAVLFITAILFPFIRCEQCDTYFFWRSERVLPLVFKGSYRDFIWPPKRCPVCGVERY